MPLLAVAGCISQNSDDPTTDNGVPLSALSYNPKAAAINAELGVGYLQQGDIERAKMKLLMAQKQDPDSSVVAASIAYYYDKIGNPKEAERYYKRAYSLATEKGDAANNYGVFLCKQKKYTAAYNYFQKAIDDPNYVSTAQTYENLGLCHWEQNDTVVAKNYFLKALRIDPKLATSLLQMAQIGVNAKDWAAAENYLMQYTATGEQSPDAMWLGIQTAQALGDEEKAMNLAKRLKIFYPNSVQYRQYLATTRGMA